MQTVPPLNAWVALCLWLVIFKFFKKPIVIWVSNE